MPEQDSDLTSAHALRGEAALPRIAVDEHCLAALHDKLWCHGPIGWPFISIGNYYHHDGGCHVIFRLPASIGRWAGLLLISTILLSRPGLGGFLFGIREGAGSGDRCEVACREHYGAPGPKR